MLGAFGLHAAWVARLINKGQTDLLQLSLSLTTERIIGCHAVATLNLHIVSNAE